MQVCSDLGIPVPDPRRSAETRLSLLRDTYLPAFPPANDVGGYPDRHGHGQELQEVDHSVTLLSF
jgi:hypothetical protein